MIKSTKGNIYLIDDDSDVRWGVALLLLSEDYHVETFKSATEFIASDNITGPGCILLDIFMKGESGLDLQEEITNKCRSLPVIYITGQGDIQMSVQALKKGAINFLQKPIDNLELIKAIEEAIVASVGRVSEHNIQDRLKPLIGSLTPRELEIFKFVITGILNKQIAARLNIAEHTVRLHRGKITKKLGVKSVAELINIAEISGIK